MSDEATIEKPTTDAASEGAADEQTNTPEGDGTQIGPSEGESPDSTSDPENPQGQRLSREAARYRTRLREVETQRDSLAETVTRLQTAELHREAGKYLSAPEDLLKLSAKELGEFLTETGDVDPDLVASVAAEVLSSRPLLSVHQSPVDHSQGHGGGAGKPKPSWGDLLRN